MRFRAPTAAIIIYTYYLEFPNNLFNFVLALNISFYEEYIAITISIDPAPARGKISRKPAES